MMKHIANVQNVDGLMMTELKKISELDSSDKACAICGGDGWVCEEHPYIPWGDGERCCSAAGMPCVCNALHSSRIEK